MPQKKTAVVTGANRGIGLEVARVLGRDHGFHVVLTGRSAESVNAAAEALAGEGIEASASTLDVTSVKDAERLAAELDASGFDIGVLINNAGIFPARHADALATDATDLISAFTTNTCGPFVVTRALSPLLRKNGHARVVNVSSGMGQLSSMGGGSVGYRVSKAGLNALTIILAQELATDGVKVNAVCPGWVKTDMGTDSAPRSVEEGAASVVWAAVLDDDGPTGGFFRDGEALDW